MEAHFYGEGVFLRRRHISTAEVYFYGGGTFLRGGVFLRRQCDFYERGQFKSNRLIRHLYGKETPMHGAVEFLCRNCVILKCEAVALVGHRKSHPIFSEAFETEWPEPFDFSTGSSSVP